ncbi:MAG TPA: hypothetical protein VNW95_09645 [Mucilaginibacter sp.]|nr:hypothetical protein [Mucilaginibacter sp.]
MKKIILFFITIISVLICKAQDEERPRFAIGTEAAYGRGFTNLNTQYDRPAFNLSLIYNHKPHFSWVAELQSGELSGGGLKPSEDISGRVYNNFYLAFNLHADFRLEGMINTDGQLFNKDGHTLLNFIKNFYFGAGAGFIANNVSVQRYSIYVPTYRFGGSDHSINPTIAVRIGHELKIYDAVNDVRYAIDIGYTHNIVFNSGLDGYNDPHSIFQHSTIGQYRQFIIGVKHYLKNK